MAEAVTACQGCLTRANIGSCASILDWKLRSPERWEKSVRLWASHVSECVNCATEHWKRCVVPVVISWQSFPEVETGCCRNRSRWARILEKEAICILHRPSVSNPTSKRIISTAGANRRSPIPHPTRRCLRFNWLDALQAMPLSLKRAADSPNWSSYRRLYTPVLV